MEGSQTIDESKVIEERYQCPYCRDKLQCEEMEYPFLSEDGRRDETYVFHLWCIRDYCKCGRIEVVTDMTLEFMSAKETTGRNGYQQMIDLKEPMLLKT